ncbi:MAG TPA: glycine cleavage system aminomethyltransferase GcvT [Parvularculaceae bacterium]|nr:glycine cleavage system aminomethyltransferase GcvT [Parvularculaceae bacterium]
MPAKPTTSLKRTALHGLHLSLGAKMVEFAGYDMPVQYPDGVLKEHLHTRAKAGLFDVSHMGQALLRTTRIPLGSDDAHLDVADAIETLVPAEIKRLKKGGQRYAVFLNDKGGILDDLMISRPIADELQGELFLVVNAAMKDQDFALMGKKLGDRAALQAADRRSLIALQGPLTAPILEEIVPGVASQTFMTMRSYLWGGADLIVTRSGYTGEDGFEISVPDSCAEDFAKKLLAHPDVAPIGLGARDSLRLEAGLCLYGHDLNNQVSPIEGNIAFAIGKRRREEGGFPGAERILRELKEGPKRLRVGIKPEGRTPAREGVEILSAEGEKIGEITSGGFGPTANGPVAMGYVNAAHSKTGTKVQLMVRGKALPAEVVDMPVIPHRYYRG